MPKPPKVLLDEAPKIWLAVEGEHTVLETPHVRLVWTAGETALAAVGLAAIMAMLKRNPLGVQDWHGQTRIMFRQIPLAGMLQVEGAVIPVIADRTKAWSSVPDRYQDRLVTDLTRAAVLLGAADRIRAARDMYKGLSTEKLRAN